MLSNGPDRRSIITDRELIDSRPTETHRITFRSTKSRSDSAIGAIGRSRPSIREQKTAPCATLLTANVYTDVDISATAERTTSSRRRDSPRFSTAARSCTPRARAPTSIRKTRNSERVRISILRDKTAYFPVLIPFQVRRSRPPKCNRRARCIAGINCSV